MGSVRVLVDRSAVPEVVPPDGRRLGPRQLSAGRGRAVEEIATETLKTNLARLGGELQDVVASVPAGGAFALTEVTVTVEIAADGGFNIVGLAKAEVGLTGGIQLTFTRKPG
jgi:hypothetical protein